MQRVPLNRKKTPINRKQHRKRDRKRDSRKNNDRKSALTSVKCFMQITAITQKHKQFLAEMQAG